jgi:hypothetical protein
MKAFGDNLAAAKPDHPRFRISLVLALDHLSRFF